MHFRATRAPLTRAGDALADRVDVVVECRRSTRARTHNDNHTTHNDTVRPATEQSIMCSGVCDPVCGKLIGSRARLTSSSWRAAAPAVALRLLVAAANRWNDDDDADDDDDDDRATVVSAFVRPSAPCNRPSTLANVRFCCG